MDGVIGDRSAHSRNTMRSMDEKDVMKHLLQFISSRTRLSFIMLQPVAQILFVRVTHDDGLAPLCGNFFVDASYFDVKAQQRRADSPRLASNS